MAISTYRRSRRRRNTVAVVLALLLIVAAVKVYYGWKKAGFFAQAEAQLTAGNAQEAEALFLKARSIRAIDYKEAETANALGALQPVTHAQRLLESIAEKIAAAAAVNDVDGLLQADGSYRAAQAAARDEASRLKFAEIAAEQGIEERLAEAFAAARSALADSLEDGIARKRFDGDAAIAYLIRVPAAYYEGDAAKRQALNPLLQKYDQARLDAWANTKSLEQWLREGDGLREFYKERQWEAAWIVPKLRTVAQAALGKLEASDLGAFLAAAKTVEAYPDLAGQGSKLASYVQSAVNGRFKRAEQLADAGRFAEAAELYKTLGGYRDTAAQVETTEQKWLAADPVHLLEQAGARGTLSAATSLKATDGALAEAAAVMDKRRVVLARLWPDRRIELAEGAAERELAPKSIRLADDFSPSRLPVLVVEAASELRSGRYALFEMQGSALRNILDLEADKLARVRTGLLLAVNPVRGEAGRGQGMPAAGTPRAPRVSPPPAAGQTSSTFAAPDAGAFPRTFPARAAGGASGELGAETAVNAYYEYRNGRYTFAGIQEERVADAAATTGTAGVNGAAGAGGATGANGAAGASGTTGANGAADAVRKADAAGTAGATGTAGTANADGTAGAARKYLPGPPADRQPNKQQPNGVPENPDGRR